MVRDVAGMESRSVLVTEQAYANQMNNRVSVAEYQTNLSPWKKREDDSVRKNITTWTANNGI